MSTASTLDRDRSLRADFKLLESVSYLNSASCSLVPSPVITAMTDYYATAPVNYRSGHTPPEEQLTQRIDTIRDRLSAHIGAASSTEVVFTKNTTEGLNFVASGLRWAAGDEVVVTPLEHQSNVIPWMRLAREQGARLVYAPVGNDGRLDMDAFRSILSPRTRLVSIHHVSNLLGTIQDITTVSRIAHEFGALVLVDAAQSEGRIPVDVSALGCDFLASCARKGLMGPQGVGFLWVRGPLTSSLRSLCTGGLAARVIDSDRYEELPAPYRYEAGIPNTAGLIGLGAALDYAQLNGRREDWTSLTPLCNYLVEELGHVPGIQIHGPTDPSLRAGIVSWSVTDRDTKRVAEFLYDEHRVAIAAGKCGSPLAVRSLGVPAVLRASLQVYNNVDDVDKLVRGLKAAIGVPSLVL